MPLWRVAMDLIWGFAGILSLGHGLFFALGATPSACT
jgi:urea transport system permease protein